MKHVATMHRPNNGDPCTVEVRDPFALEPGRVAKLTFLACRSPHPMTTPNNAAALECVLDEMGAFIEQEESPNLDTLENWHQRLRATLAQLERDGSFVHTVPDKCDRIMWRGHYYHLTFHSRPLMELTSQPSGEAVAARLTVYADTKAITARIHDVAHSLAPGTYDLYTHPSADAPAGVNSSLRVAALALADLAERNTDDLDLWQAAIAAVRNAADAPGVAVDEAMIERGICVLFGVEDAKGISRTEHNIMRDVLTAALAPKPEGEL